MTTKTISGRGKLYEHHDDEFVCDVGYNITAREGADGRQSVTGQLDGLVMDIQNKLQGHGFILVIEDGRRLSVVSRGLRLSDIEHGTLNIRVNTAI